MKNHFEFTADEITEAIDTWANFTGFTGETCGKCQSKVNMLHGPGWICECGHFNALAINAYQEVHTQPDWGPTAEVIKLGYQNSKKYQAMKRDLAKVLNVEVIKVTKE